MSYRRVIGSPFSGGRGSLAWRLTQLLLGLFLFGIAIALMIRASLGISPWDCLAQGISLISGLSFGLVNNLIGGAVLLVWIPLRQRLGVGCVLNVMLVGPSADFGLNLIPPQTNLLVQILCFVAGVVLLAFATGLYIGARFGPGPRDGLMTGLHARTGWPIWGVRGGLEIIVLGVGWLLGGNAGIGTLVFAAVIGPLVNLFMPMLRTPGIEPSGRRPRLIPSA